MTKNQLIKFLEWHIEEICKASVDAGSYDNSESDEDNDKRRLLGYHRCAALADSLQQFLTMYGLFDEYETGRLIKRSTAKTYTYDRYTEWDERVSVLRHYARSIVTVLESLK
jgi:hypothetical protein